MIPYLKFDIRRIRGLNDRFYEILFSKRSLNFSPGQAIKLYNLEHEFFLASGVQEAWVRIIVDRNVMADYPQRDLKIERDLLTPIPNLMAEESPNFLITSSGIAPFFSYVSTFPDKKCKVCYIGDDKISESWVKSNHNMVSLKDIKKVANLYVIGENDLLHRKATGALNNAKFVYTL